MGVVTGGDLVDVLAGLGFGAAALGAVAVCVPAAALQDEAGAARDHPLGGRLVALGAIGQRLCTDTLFSFPLVLTS